jgi:uncharacterized membrane protein YdjX (TVP38/TMEM64 family)
MAFQIYTARPRIADFPLKPLIMLGVMAALFLLVHITPVRNYLGDIQSVKRWLVSLGCMGPVVWMGIVFMLVIAGTPRLLFCPISGLAFGFWHGLLWTQMPTLAGYYVLFLFVRWGGKGFVLRRWPRVGRFKDHFNGHSATLLVFGVRQLPMSGLIINFLLGLSPIRHRDFLLGTVFGILPEAIPFTLVASGTLKLTSQNTPLYVGAAVVLLLFMCTGLWYFSCYSKLQAQLREESIAAEEDKDPPPGPS